MLSIWTIRSGLMVNTLLLSHRALGSAALRCGASSFGVKSLGVYSKCPSKFVAVFKSQIKRNKFLSFLRSQNLQFEKHFDYRYKLYKGEFVYMVFVKLYRFIPKEKIGFKNFRQLCNSQEVQIYTNPFYQHPNKSKTNFN